ncbi:MAG: putative protein YciH [Chlamydiia bacterium]|nr:putative protein YciH [Chlamydiia bacterium]MCH9615467.1 putative protein YciH [Chlamydiia bacterium]MCH9629122.1 putative protein YciH [Chlamydiia bacterium]
MGVVYSSEKGAMCPKCQKPETECLCPTGKLRVRKEMKGRGGKCVTLVEGLPKSVLKDVATSLKRKLGTGGAVKGITIEIQGDRVDDIKVELKKLGYPAK